MFQARQQLRWGEHVHSRCRQFQRQRQSVHAHADRGEGRGIVGSDCERWAVRPDARHKELHRRICSQHTRLQNLIPFGYRQRWHGIGLFAGNP
jgi:hypothetical protein